MASYKKPTGVKSTEAVITSAISTADMGYLYREGNGEG